MRAQSRQRRPVPSWPMIILRTPKGWTCPKEIDGVPIEGTFRAHQVPLANVCENPEHLKMLEAWMQKYKPDELFDEDGRLIAELAELAPDGDLPHGRKSPRQRRTIAESARSARLRSICVVRAGPGRSDCGSAAQARRIFTRRHQAQSRQLSLFCPDETNSNRLNAVFEATNRCTMEEMVSDRRPSGS